MSKNAMSKNINSTKRFAYQLVTWQLKHGRHDLPWQNTHDAYKIWLSEIMLQQTQVATVKNYYARFIERFPNLSSLASAKQDEVLALWTGLGYYNRARNLHTCAQTVMEKWGGNFPYSPEQLQTLKGIGASTAAAIAVFANGYPATILDGNVKRVLCRFFNIDAAPCNKTDQQLLTLAKHELLSSQESKELSLSHADGLRAYTQGLMDLGSSLCTRNNPQCQSCPLNKRCSAYIYNKTNELPRRKIKTTTREEVWHFIIYRFNEKLWLEQRAHSGIWASLYAFPESLHIKGAKLVKTLPTIKHRLSHRLLTLNANVFDLTTHQIKQLELKNPKGTWLSKHNISSVGMPKPILVWATYLLVDQDTSPPPC